MRAICRTIDGVTYDTGTSDAVQRMWVIDHERGAEVEVVVYRSEEGRWFEVRREPGQLYGELRPVD